ncbi:MAG TPA: hypothetical protein VIN08_28360, partial [Ohtaekwangia sp.]|uniref:hypothetical protein n=1 Tax=Ohtaekwangia sp. TaxID=2066019 RepID=UPI002F92F301
LLYLSLSHVVGQQYVDFVLKPVDKADTLGRYLEFKDAHVSADEIENHKLVWKVKEVRVGAASLREKRVQAFTMTDEQPTQQHPYFVIGFYELLAGHYTRLDTFRVGKDHTVEKFDFFDNRWTPIR